MVYTHKCGNEQGTFAFGSPHQAGCSGSYLKPCYDAFCTAQASKEKQAQEEEGGGIGMGRLQARIGNNEIISSSLNPLRMEELEFCKLLAIKTLQYLCVTFRKVSESDGDIKCSVRF